VVGSAKQSSKLLGSLHLGKKKRRNFEVAIVKHDLVVICNVLLLLLLLLLLIDIL
jgi:hypothetical protein